MSLIAGEIERFDGIGIIYVLFSREFVETLKTNDLVRILLRHDFPPDFIRNVKVKLILAIAYATLLPLKSPPIAWFHISSAFLLRSNGCTNY
jgi:hypothetical protein